MTQMAHEVWQDYEEGDGAALPGCCLAGPRGDGFRALLSARAHLLHTFKARSHAEAMTAYHRLVGFGPYATKHEWDEQPYPEEWARESRRETDEDAALK